jgi:hypothetical protein
MFLYTANLEFSVIFILAQDLQSSAAAAFSKQHVWTNKINALRTLLASHYVCACTSDDMGSEWVIDAVCPGVNTANL